MMAGKKLEKEHPVSCVVSSLVLSHLIGVHECQRTGEKTKFILHLKCEVIFRRTASIKVTIFGILANTCKMCRNTVDGSEIRPAPLEVGSFYPIIYDKFYRSRNSSINSIWWDHKKIQLKNDLNIPNRPKLILKRIPRGVLREVTCFCY